MVLCGCGCGNEVISRAKDPIKRLNAKFCFGHKRSSLTPIKQLPPIRCACGCGQLLEKRISHGRILKFIHGHNGRGALHYDYKGGKYINDQGYVMVLRPDHPRATSNGYVREHILVMEAFLGRPLKLPEVIHHINHNRQDNRIENLQLFESTSIHMATAHKHRTKRNVTIDNQGQITPNFIDTSGKVIH